MREWSGGVWDSVKVRGEITELWQDLGSAIFPLRVSAVDFRPRIYMQALLYHAVLTM